jgi:hypothetical protein
MRRFPLPPYKQPRADEGSFARSFASLLLKTTPEDVNFLRFSRQIGVSVEGFCFVHAAEVAITLQGETKATCVPDKLPERKEEATK